MVEKITEILTDPNNPNFWNALTLFATILIALGGLLGWILTNIFNNNISKTTRILIDSITEVFLSWVKVESKSQKVDNNNIQIWISENGGGILTGRSYLIYKKLIKQLKKQGFSHLRVMEKELYEKWVFKYDSSPKWERKGW